ncbi:MAG: hypothetical protein ABL930_06805, partial [Pseudobdellovibrio sp.]
QSDRAVYSTIKVLRDDQMPMGKNLIIDTNSSIAGSSMQKLEYGYDSTPTGLRLKLHEDDEMIVYLFSSTIGGNFMGKGGTKVSALSIEDKKKQSGSIGSQLEFLECK